MTGKIQYVCPAYEDAVLCSEDEELDQKEEKAKPDLKKAKVNFNSLGSTAPTDMVRAMSDASPG